MAGYSVSSCPVSMDLVVDAAWSFLLEGPSISGTSLFLALAVIKSLCARALELLNGNLRSQSYIHFSSPNIVHPLFLPLLCSVLSTR